MSCHRKTTSRLQNPPPWKNQLSSSSQLHPLSQQKQPRSANCWQISALRNRIEMPILRGRLISCDHSFCRRRTLKDTRVQELVGRCWSRLWAALWRRWFLVRPLYNPILAMEYFLFVKRLHLKVFRDVWESHTYEDPRLIFRCSPTCWPSLLYRDFHKSCPVSAFRSINPVLEARRYSVVLGGKLSVWRIGRITHIWMSLSSGIVTQQSFSIRVAWSIRLSAMVILESPSFHIFLSEQRTDKSWRSTKDL